MRLAALIAFALAVPAFAGDVKLTGENTKITFVGTKPGGKHEGGFKTLSGTVTVDADKKVTKIEVEIDTDSLWSDNEKLTQHLKAPDFFNVKANPKAKFVSTKIEGSGEQVVTGNLTLNGKTKEISFQARMQVIEGKLGIGTDFKINKNDFGMTYGGGKIDDDVAVKVVVDAK